MDEFKSECRRCLLLQSGIEDVYKEVQRCVAKIRPEEKTGESDYAERLRICSECDFLVSGTCLKCGCYAELRAAYKNNHCPLAGSKKKW